jgi:type VI secretion system protein ImpB
MGPLASPFEIDMILNLSGHRPVGANTSEPSVVPIEAGAIEATIGRIAPRVVFEVPNMLSGEGVLAIDLEFRSMNDFSPNAIAMKIAPLAKLMEARAELESLMSYSKEQDATLDLLDKILKNPVLLKTLASGPEGGPSVTPTPTAAKPRQGPSSK